MNRLNPQLLNLLIQQEEPPVIQVPRKSVRIRTEHEMYRFWIDGDQSKTLMWWALKLWQILKKFKHDSQLKAMKSEMDSMSENKVWTLSDAPEGVKLIGCKHVLKDENGHGR